MNTPQNTRHNNARFTEVDDKWIGENIKLWYKYLVPDWSANVNHYIINKF